MPCTRKRALGMKDQQLRKSWKQDAAGVKRDILSVAMAEFAESGLAGARIDAIAEKTKTSKRMIYYYFGDKEGLYIATLEAIFERVLHEEAELDIDGMMPEQALASFVEFVFDQHRNNPDLIRVVMNENILHAKYMQKSEIIGSQNVTLTRRLERIIERGQAQGVFREGIDPMFIYWQMQAQAFYNVSNRPSFSTKFSPKFFDKEGQAYLRAEMVDSILRYVRVCDDDDRAKDGTTH